VQQILERIEARPEYIPRRPSLLPKLLATVNDNEATMMEMSRIIAQDPALTGNLLRSRTARCTARAACPWTASTAR
jgi:HD-like signal output (HDOD) protein